MHAPLLRHARAGGATAIARSARRAGADREGSLVVQMASRVSRDSIFYTVVTGAIFPIGLLNAVILTHYLNTTQFGQLGVLLFAAGLTTVVLNLFFLRGTERQVWGGSEEGVDIDQDELVAIHERPRVLGTGLMLGIVLSVLMVAALVPLAPEISSLLVHTTALSAAVVWAGVSGALGSTWRLVANIGRWERRKIGFGVVWVSRPAVALALSWPLVAAGYGVTGAVAATAIATFVSLAAGLVISRRSYEIVLDGYAAKRIGRSSAQFAAMVTGLFILHNGDVFFLSRFASSSQVGVYKLATNVTSLVSYAVSAFLMAWSPLEFSTLFRAAYERHGQERLRGEFAHYYLVLGIFIVLALAALANPLIGVFSSSYRSAGGFVAITGAGYLAYGLFLVVARSSTFPRRYLVYGLAALASAIALAVTSVLLGRPLGGYGVAVGDVVGGLAGVAIIVFVAAIWGALPQINLRRMAALLVIGGACYLIGGPLAPGTGALDPALKITSVVAFLVLLVVGGVVPRHHLRSLIGTVRSTVRSRSGHGSVVEQVWSLPPTDQLIIAGLVRGGTSPAQLATRFGIPERIVRERFMASLRRLAGVGPPGPDDDGIASYLLAGASVTERDGLARNLWSDQVEIMDLHALEVTFNALRDAPSDEWRSVARDPDEVLAGGTWALDPPARLLIEEVVRRGRPTDTVAQRLGLSALEAGKQLVAAVRRMAGDGGPRPADQLIGAFLFASEDRPAAAQLWSAGVDPLEVHRLELAIARMRALPDRDWGKRIAATSQPDHSLRARAAARLPRRFRRRQPAATPPSSDRPAHPRRP
jgi:O-antigen/teichoic acid export membrane protein